MLPDGQLRTPHQTGINLQMRNSQIRSAVENVDILHDLDAAQKHRRCLYQAPGFANGKPAQGVNPQLTLNQTGPLSPRRDLKDIGGLFGRADGADVAKLVVRG